MFRKTWFYRLLLSYMPIIIIIISFLFFVFFQMLSEQQRKEAIAANKMLSEQAIRLIDTQLKAIDQMIMMETINNAALNAFFSAKPNDNVYININADKQLDRLMNYYTLIDSIYLVRFNDRFVLSNSTTSDLDAYPDADFIKRHMELVISRQWTGVRTFMEFPVIGDKPVISLARGVPFLSGEKGMIVVNIDVKGIASLASGLYDSETSFIRIVDGNGVALTKGASESASARTFSSYTSGYTGWTYESGLMQGQFVKLISSLYNVWFIIGLVMIGLALLGVIFVTRRNSRPLEQIVSRIRGYTQPSESLNAKEKGRIEEFSVIESAFDHLIGEFKHYEQKHKEDLLLRRNYLFQQLVSEGEAKAMERWAREAEDMLLPAPADAQLLLVAEVDQIHAFCERFSPRDQSLLKFALRHIMEEIALAEGKKLWCEWVTPSCLGVIIVDADQEDESDILSMMDNVRQWTMHHLKFTITIGVGEMARSREDIPRSFRKAQEALKYKITLGENRIITWETIANQEQVEVYAHLHAIRSIVQSFRMLEDWKSKHDELFLELKQGLLTKDEVRHLMSYLIYSLGREMASISTAAEELWECDGLPQLGDCMENGQSVDQIGRQSGVILQQLSDKLGELQAGNQHADTIRSIRHYLKEEYSNPLLSLDHLGEVYGLSPKYLSKLFKEETGQKFVDFLIDIRMKEAERLLLETDMTVQEAAEGVGYTSAISFSRVFKKLKGLTPSEFREREARKGAS
ncbi:helix-turn-helix domain-containing protein [Paenibacillus sp. J5C_2022]|uniref:helix-turn-helix domain-containing protein n=1 Tax=Paenibacillus sp. J5C2022 TaxID=2977129 RepID=UPI0021CE0D7A|nr:helix-turn-helix domain-containing protein [Paenibacillus sp. J5C2022]MCU6712543.1 helix-turn-helix domain-containing protein [Paenibacillus sp. J5C2022]